MRPRPSRCAPLKKSARSLIRTTRCSTHRSRLKQASSTPQTKYVPGSKSAGPPSGDISRPGSCAQSAWELKRVVFVFSGKTSWPSWRRASQTLQGLTPPQSRPRPRWHMDSLDLTPYATGLFGAGAVLQGPQRSDKIATGCENHHATISRSRRISGTTTRYQPRKPTTRWQAWLPHSSSALRRDDHST